MFVMEKGDQKILLIGELHDNDFRDKQGCRPLAQYIEQILRDTKEPIDFMLELNIHKDFINKRNQTYAKINNVFLDHIRRVVQAKDNYQPFPYMYGDEPFTNLQLLRDIVEQYIPYQKDFNDVDYKHKDLRNARVHWLEPRSRIYTEEDLTLPANRVMDCLNRFLDAYVDESVKPEEKLKLISQINREIGSTDPAFIHQEDFDFEKTTEVAQLAFFRKLFRTLEKSKLLRKCFEEDRAQTLTNYFKAFQAFLHRSEFYSEEYPTIFDFYFRLQRFLLDTFAVCRIMKRPSNRKWLKNIVIYAGVAHITGISELLHANFYKTYKVPRRINFLCY